MTRVRLWGAVLAAALAFLLVSLASASAQDFPRLTGRVVDQAGMLPPDVEADLDRKLAELEARTTDQVVVATVSSLEGRDIADYGYRLGRAWGIGQSERTQTVEDRTGRDNGVILLIAPNERKVRIEVGYGLEPVLTDALSSVIIQSAILPKFRDGDLPGGVTAGVDAIVEQLSIDRGLAQQRAQAARAQLADQGGTEIPWWVVLLVVLFFVFFGRGWLPWFILGNLAGGGWRGGGGGGWSGGGGFSGGGGSFGGGGASGGW